MDEQYNYNDELYNYLKYSQTYKIEELEKILNTKITISNIHIKNFSRNKHEFNIITLFEKYGYIFTIADYTMLINNSCTYFCLASDKSYELCKIAVSIAGILLYFVPNDKLTTELYELAVKQDGQALDMIPYNMRTYDLCKLAVQQNGNVLLFVPKHNKTIELCRIAMQQNLQSINYIPDELSSGILNAEILEKLYN